MEKIYHTNQRYFPGLGIYSWVLTDNKTEWLVMNITLPDGTKEGYMTLEEFENRYDFLEGLPWYKLNYTRFKTLICHHQGGSLPTFEEWCRAINN